VHDSRGDRDAALHVRLPTLGFLGWFDPRTGLDRFAVIIIEESSFPTST
jgi:hypothetical protein